MKTKTQLTNRILSIVLALVLMVGILPITSFTASATETEYDGVIGELYYKVDQENNVTTIFGNGALSSTTALVNVMTSNVVIEEGVTSIGNTAFRGLSSLEELTVKGDVTIGNYAFQGCASLETVTFMGNVTSVGNYAFHGCDGLSTIYYYGTTEPSYANALSSVTLYSSKGVSFCGLTPSNLPATQDPCSGDHTGWTELSSLTETVPGCYEITSGGKYYLSDDVRNSTNYRPTIRITCTEDVTLCLNGKTIYPAQSPSSMVVSLSADSTLNLCDCADTGRILGEEEILFAYNNATINMYSGTLKDSTRDAVYLMDGASFNMYGGTITGCNQWYGEAAITSYYFSQINIYGGNISDNHKYAIRTDGSIYISGDAKITGNVKGDVYLREGQTITTGTLTSGADIGITTVASENDIAITGSNTADYSRYFHSDNSSYAITNKGNTIYLHKHTCTYSATKNIITQTCSVCNKHTATATLTADDVIYTGSAVATGASVTFSDNWAGSKEHGEITYSNNLNVGDATAKVTVEGKVLTTTFKINAAKISGAAVTLNPTSGTYTGTAYNPSVSVTLDDFGTLVEGTDYTLSWNKTGFTNADIYTVTITGKGNFEGTKNAVFRINPAEIKGAVVTLDQYTFVYDGQSHKPTAIVTFNGDTLTEGVDYEVYYLSSDQIMTWTNGEPVKFFGTGKESCDSINAGQYYVVVFGKGNFADNGRFAYAAYTIEKATITEPTIATKPYTGSEQTADVTDTDLYTVVKNEGGTGVKQNGTYDVVLELKDPANYKWSTTDNAQVTLQFAITQGTNEWTVDPSISGWTYGEAANTPVGEAKFGDVSVKYSGTTNGGAAYNSTTAPTEAGNYKATFIVQGTEDYKGLETSVDFTIAKKTVTVTANDASKIYGDSDPALTYTHTEVVGQDALDITVSRASGENSNTYTITASQAEGANPNYEITFKNGTFTIHKAPLTITAEDKTATYGDTVPTYTVKYEGFMNGDDRDDLGGALAFYQTYNRFDDVGEYEIMPHGLTSDNYVIAYNFGKLTVNAKPITVTIQNATSVYGDTLAELKATDNGIVNGDANVYSLATTATGTSNVGKYAITGTALDSNYDVTFVNGEYEITKREITITVDAKNTVVNTTLPTYTYKVEGLAGVDALVTKPTLTCNANIAVIGEYDITATGADAGGNYSIKYVPAKLTVLTDNAVDAAAGYTEELKDYDPATVTSEDKEELEEMLSEINTILADETTTENGKKALEEVKEQVEKLIKEITDAAEATDTENTVKVENVTPENVTPENKTDLEGAKADLEKALEDNGGNYTEDEKKAIEDELGRIDEALEVIGNVEAVEEGISKLPAVDTVKPDDEETIKAITDAQTAYNALSDYEKSLVDEATKANLDKLVAALVAYDIVEGDGSSWTEDSNHNITFVVNGLFSKFVGIKVDGKDVDKANYEVKAGSTIITLKASYLDTLAVGEHTISVVYTDGSTDGTFNVHAKANSPATGDDFNIALYGSLMVVSVTALVVLLLASKKKKQAK